MTGPIKHVVMWRVAGDTAAERAASRAKVKAAFEGLRGRISGLRSLEVGVDVSGVDYACDIVLVSEFDSAAELEGYATHPEHLRVRRNWAICALSGGRSITTPKRGGPDAPLRL